jgi:hypothetical protein
MTHPMNMDFAVPLIAGLFMGGIITEVRWVLRLRQLQGQIVLNDSVELKPAISLAQVEVQVTPEAQSSQDLQSFRDHLAAEGGVTLATEPVTVGTRSAKQ